jgi:hypothetical protein
MAVDHFFMMSNSDPTTTDLTDLSTEDLDIDRGAEQRLDALPHTMIPEND